MAIGVKERDVEGNIIPTSVGGVKNDPTNPILPASDAAGWINPYEAGVCSGLLDNEKLDYWRCIRSPDKWFGKYNDSTDIFKIEEADTYYPNVPELNFQAFSQSGQPKNAGTINIPEPATLGLLGAGALSALGLGKRRRDWKQ